MSSQSASFSFSFTDGTLKIEGSELFVSQQIEAFKGKILDCLDGLDQPPIAIPHLTGGSDDSQPSSVAGPKADQTPAGIQETNPYPRVLDLMGDKLKITTSIKGKNTAEKAVSLILAYLWGKERLLNPPTAEFKELRELCEEHACLDSGNFSTMLSSKKNLILVDGSKGSSSKFCKLTYPGREAAEEILKALSETG